MLPEVIAETLDALSEPQVLHKRHKQMRPLRGLRGVSDSELAQVLAALQEEDPPKLPQDAKAMRTLFSAAWEDGIVAIGLCAACVPAAPGAAVDLGLEWAEMIDDVTSADALGSLVLGPGSLALDDFASVSRSLRGQGHPMARRAGVTMGLACLPEPLGGAAAAALRQALGVREVQIVEAPLEEALAGLCSTYARDDDPAVRKGLRRVIGLWAKHAPEACMTWMNGFPGGVHKMLREEASATIEKAEKKAQRQRKIAARRAKKET